ncbi:hypothetical protein [Devosia sp. 2618]|uniref:helix-turn-helix transcriptional regulator n=1 Tax=Devosia sp. 2618 TaxID=3156454 RepID=UPI0033955D3A
MGIRSSALAELSAPSLPRIGYTRSEAAEIVGVGTDLFDRAVAAGAMPPPRQLGKRLLWDIDELVRAFRDLPHKGASNADDGESSSVDKDMV